MSVVDDRVNASAPVSAATLINNSVNAPKATDTAMSSSHTAAAALGIEFFPPAELRQLYARHLSREVPANTVFPFLYCGRSGTPQQHMFLHGSTDPPPVPTHRGLTIVRAESHDTMPEHSVLLSSLRLQDLVDVHAPHGPRFLVPSKVGDSTGIRHFAAQSIHYAMISDIVVYGPDGMCDTVFDTARALRDAQLEFFRERRTSNPHASKFRTYIVPDPFTTLEIECPNLVAISSRGERRRLIDLFQRENDELHFLTAPTAISKNVWVSTSDHVHPDTPSMSPAHRPFTINIEVYPHAVPPAASFLQSVTQNLRQFDVSQGHGSPSRRVPRAQLECPNAMQQTKALPELALRILELCAWLHRQVHPDKCTAPQIPRHALMHCDDGYTEVSVLALAYLMYQHGLTLSDAYLYMHLHLERPFFVTPSDFQLLLLIEQRVPRMRRQSLSSKVATSPTALKSCSSAFSSSPASTMWIQSTHFDGSLPSRILPFLYLGTVFHAMNARLLEQLGITHVVSVGESAMQVKGPYTLQTAYYTGEVDVLEIEHVPDDGLHGLGEHLITAIQYIERARQQGGRVLVHCRFGVSRSATVVLAYVMAHMDWCFVDAFVFVRSRRLRILIQPHALFVWELCNWETYLVRQKRTGHMSSPIDIGCGRYAYVLLPKFRHALGDFPVTWSYLCHHMAALHHAYVQRGAALSAGS